MVHKILDINRAMLSQTTVKQPMVVQLIMVQQRKMEVMLQLSMMIDPTVVMVSDFFLFLFI